MNSMKFDTEKKGLLTVFRQYQIASLLSVFYYSKTGATSSTVHNEIRDSPIADVRKSRASVINFLNDMVDDGILDYVERTGKGGHHRVYFPTERVYDMKTLKTFVAQKVMTVLDAELLN